MCASRSSAQSLALSEGTVCLAFSSATAIIYVFKFAIMQSETFAYFVHEPVEVQDNVPLVGAGAA